MPLILSNFAWKQRYSHFLPKMAFFHIFKTNQPYFSSKITKTITWFSLTLKDLEIKCTYFQYICHRSWGDAHLSFGRRKRPKLRWDRPKTYRFCQSPHFQICDFKAQNAVDIGVLMTPNSKALCSTITKGEFFNSFCLHFLLLWSYWSQLTPVKVQFQRT